MLEKHPKLFTANTYARKTTFARITTDARIARKARSSIIQIQCHALFIHITSLENVQGLTELRNRRKNESNMLERTKWRNKRKTDSHNVTNIVT